MKKKIHDAGLRDVPPVADSELPPSTPDRFAVLRGLQKGWDGYGADPLDPATVDRAESFLNAVSIVPCADGGVQLEWHTREVDLEIEFEPNGAVYVDGEARGVATNTDLIPANTESR